MYILVHTHTVPREYKNSSIFSPSNAPNLAMAAFSGYVLHTHGDDVDLAEKCIV